MRIILPVLFVLMVSPAFGEEQPKPFDFEGIPEEVQEIDVPARIHVRSRQDAERVRKELIAFIWINDGQLPERAEVERMDLELPQELAAAPATCESLTIRLPREFSAVVYHFRLETPTKKLAIVHQGHNYTWAAGIDRTVRLCLDRGYSVMLCQMPLLGDNNGRSPKPFMGNHDDLAILVSNEFDPISLFLEPVVVATNYGIKQHNYQDIVMMGLSGGGWTTTLSAAIDPRIRLSIPVAGTFPDYLRIHPRDKGDWEQSYPELYKVANYLDLYILGSTGEGREQRQVLNKYDECCFAGVLYQTYLNHVQEAVSDVGNGKFDVFLDESHRKHQISDETLAIVIGPLLKAR